MRYSKNLGIYQKNVRLRSFKKKWELECISLKLLVFVLVPYCWNWLACCEVVVVKAENLMSLATTYNNSNMTGLENHFREENIYGEKQ